MRNFETFQTVVGLQGAHVCASLVALVARGTNGGWGESRKIPDSAWLGIVQV